MHYALAAEPGQPSGPAGGPSAPSASPGTPTNGTAGAPAPTAPIVASATDATARPPGGGVQVTAPSGAVVHADLRGDYVAGFPMLVEITVVNPTGAAVSFPDLNARPWLVRFQLQFADRKTERLTTPPATDPGTMWSIPPRGRKRVLLEIPSSGAFKPQAGTLTVAVADGSGATLALGPHPVRIAEAQPRAQVVHEPTIASASGPMLPWVQPTATGADLYLLHHRPDGRLAGNYHLTSLPAPADVVLSRSRSADATTRWLYWKSGERTLTLARLAGPRLGAEPTVVSVPYPNAELFGRGATDGRGGLIVPLWIPSPKGAAGSLRALCVDSAGGQVLRKVVDLPSRPTVSTSAVDAGGNLLLALATASGLDLYRVDPTLAPELPARGLRAFKLENGASVGGLAFDSLPDTSDRAGGLALVSLLLRPAEKGTTVRTQWIDLGGKLIQESPDAPWVVPGPVHHLLSSGFGAWYALSKGAEGWFYTPQGGKPAGVALTAPGALVLRGEEVRIRTLANGSVVAERAVGARVP